MTVTEPTDLERCIAAGETSITSAMLAAEVKAERESRDHRNAKESERCRADQDRADREAAGARLLERERLERIAALGRLITERFGAGEHEGSVAAAFDAAVAALVPFVEAIVEHNEALKVIHRELHDLAPLPPEVRVPGENLNVIHLPGADVFIQPIDTASLGAEVLWRALDAAGQGSSRAASELSGQAGIVRDHAAAERYGVPARPDGGAGVTGPSDALRRIARIVAERDA